MRYRWCPAFVAVVAVFIAGACTDSTSPPKPVALALTGVAPASAPAATTVSGITVVVNDAGGHAIVGQPLQVTVTGGGSVAGAPTSTLTGSTSIGVWTLGTKPGSNTLTIASGSLPPVVITVLVTAGPAAKIVAAGAPALVGTVGATITATFLVTDQFDNPAPGAAVQFTTTGGGSVPAAPLVTDANGLVTTTWTFGTARGPNTLTASAGGGSAKLTVVAQSDVAAAIQIAQGGSQTGNAGAALPVAPTVVVVDRFGNPVPHQVVTFAVVAGGGFTTGLTSAVTDTNGVAVAPVWTLGKRNIPQQLTATSGALTVAISATIFAKLPIVLRFFGVMSDAQKAVFQGAADRVSAMVTQGAGPVQVTAFPVDAECGVTGAAPITETIQGIVIYASIGPIDGVSNILAESGPCGFRDASVNFQPAVAVMEFDIADLATLEGGGSLEDVATHEMMHALGFGTLWADIGLVSALGTADPRYIGANGIAGCKSIGGFATCATSVPVENTGGSGTVGSHWRETTFGHELMTGFINSGANPLSAMSIASMADFGYSVSLTAADPYSIASALRAIPGVRLLPDNWERVRPMPVSPALMERVGGLLTIRPVP